jgi:DNA replication protein DnaC
MSSLNPLKETIKLYAKQLKTPSFTGYENVVRQLSSGDGYEKFLYEIMKIELSQRQEAGQRRRIKKAGFPVMKTLDEFNFSRLEHVSEGYIQELAACDFIRNKQNIVMIGNPGAGKTHLSLGLGMKACYAGFNVRFYTAVNLQMSLPKLFSFTGCQSLRKACLKLIC